jgi:hypothetical protein
MSRLAWRFRLAAAYRRISVIVIWFLITSKSISDFFVNVNHLILLFSAPIPLLAALLDKPKHVGLSFGLSAHTIHMLDLGHFGNG